MKLYLIEARQIADGGPKWHRQWRTSGTEASKARTALMEATGLKRKDVEIHEVEVDNRKEGLTAFLNAVTAGDDAPIELPKG